MSLLPSDPGFDFRAAWYEGEVEGKTLLDAIETLRAQLEAAEAEKREAWAALDSKAGWEWKKRAEAAEADAARYQLLKVWGRQMSIEGTGECNFGITTPTWRGPWIDLDAAIDAAIARTKEQQA